MTVGENAPHPALALWTLLAGSIDYAGLFPPAQLDMAGAVSEYASYLASSDAWALGRFVIPASRLDELGDAARGYYESAHSSLGADGSEWRLSALLGPDLVADVDRADAINALHDADPPGWRARVEAVELRASTPEAVAQALRAVPSSFERFVEIPIVGDTSTLVRAIGDAGASAKVRTGGTTADAFPSSSDLARFLATCVRENVPFKATAGLHHPLRGNYPLTYDPTSASGPMYGFLNLFLATAFLNAGVSQAEACELLEEGNVSAVQVGQSHVSWRSHRLDTDKLGAARHLVRSFGSCSFREPIDDLAALGMV